MKHSTRIARVMVFLAVGLLLAAVTIAAVVDYKGRSVIDSPTGAGGVIIKANTVMDADRIGSYIEHTAAPTATDDIDGPQGAAYENSLWKETTPTPDLLHMCLDNADGAAVWQKLGDMSDLVDDSTPQLGGNLAGQSYDIATTGEGAFGTTVDALRCLNVAKTIEGDTAWGLFATMVASGSEGEAIGVQSSVSVSGEGTRATGFYAQPAASNDGNAQILYGGKVFPVTYTSTDLAVGWGYEVNCSSTAGVHKALYVDANYGTPSLTDFYGLHITAGLLPVTGSKWGIYVEGCDSYFAEDVGINTTTPDTKLQVVGDSKFGDDNTNYIAISATGDQTFAGSAGFYPRVVSQNDKPAAGTGATQCDSGEYMIWIDANDSDKVYGVYNNGGTVVAVLMAL